MVQRAYMLNWTRVNQPAVPKDRHTQNFGQVYTQQVGNGSWACVKIWALVSIQIRTRPLGTMSKNKVSLVWAQAKPEPDCTHCCDF